MGNNDLALSLGFNTGGSETAVKISSIAMVVAVIFLFLVAIFLFLFYFYAHFYLAPRAAARRRAQFIFSAADVPISTCGLEAAILCSLPVTVYKPCEFKEGLECAVCLSELCEGEKARLLPKCNHGFHLQCIDMWFYSHSTCPLCRSPVGMEASAVAAETPLAESSDLPTNVLLWASQDQVNAERLASQSERSSERMLVISIPARSTEEIFAASASALPSSRSQMEEMKSPATSKLGSLRRLFSMGKRIAGSSSSSPGVCDIEQGLVGYQAAKAEGSSVLLKSPTTSLQRNLASEDDGSGFTTRGDHNLRTHYGLELRPK